MKLIMEQWRKFLKEGISDVVYHATSNIAAAAKILEDNRFLASGGFTKPDSEEVFQKGKLYYFSTARTPAASYTTEWPTGAIFKLDGRALAEKYKGSAIDYWADSRTGRSSKKAANIQKDPEASEAFEAEDRIILDEPYIDDADRYIDEVHFGVELYRMDKNMFDKEPQRRPVSRTLSWWQIEGLQEAVKAAEQKNIPYYIHIEKKTWPHVEVGKRKALTSLSDFMEVLEKSGIEVGEKPDTSGTEERAMSHLSPEEREEYKRREASRKEFGEDEVFLYVQAAQDILAGKEQFEGAEVQGDVGSTSERDRQLKGKQYFRGFAGDPDGRGRFVSDINNPLHNVSKNPKARDTLDMLASLMRSTRKKTLKDFETYINQVYKQNHPDGDPTGYRDL